MSLEQRWQRLVTGRDRGLFSRLARAALFFPSFVLGFWMALRNKAYDIGLLRSHRVGVPVISLGNITVGGSGKTPLVMDIAQRLSQNLRVAVISRGYKAPAEKQKEPTLVSQGNGPIVQADYCGDEPYLIAKNLPQCLVIAGKDRVRAAQLAESLGADCIVLDDAFQHRRLARQLDIVVVDANEKLEEAKLFPLGRLRESLNGLGRADLICYSNSECREGQALPTKAPQVHSQFQVEGVLGKETELIEDLCGLKIGAFCGIAKPRAFHLALQGLGAQIVKEELLADHASCPVEQLMDFARACEKRGAQYLVCTEKDFVKISDSEHRLCPLPILWLKRKLEWDQEDLGSLESILSSATR